MAKDAQGHGSDGRGGANGVATTFSSKNGIGVHGPGMYAKLNSGSMVKLNPQATGGRIPALGTPLDPSQHTMVSPSGDVSHLSPGGRNGYNPEAVNKAISNASRYQGKVSGREASMIHRLLKGRG